MTVTHKIVFSSMITLAFILSGCGETNTGTVDRPIVDIPDTDNPSPSRPVVVDPEIPEPLPPVDPYKPAGWYGKTQVSATAADGTVYTHTTAGIFGELLQSEEDKDKHDILGYDTSILQVVFPQTEWGDDNGDYFSNYLNYDEYSVEKRVWTFQIKNQHTVDLSNAPVTIDLEGVYDVKYKDENGKVEYKESTDVNQTLLDTLHLVDVDNQAEYTLDELKTAILSMDGLHTRTFRWVMGTVEQDDYLLLSKTTEATVSKMSVYSAEDAADTSDFNLKSESQSAGGKFGLPPQ
jgi:hypothetical protein